MKRREMLILTNLAAAAVGLSATNCEAQPTSAQEPVPYSGNIDDAVNLFDFEAVARRAMQVMAREYVVGGAGDELTVRWNREALDRIRLRPRVLLDVSKIDTRVHRPGLELPFPILVAPTGFHRLVHSEGELATARGASNARATMVLSMGTTTPVEEVMRVAQSPVWFQMYMLLGRSFMKDLIERVKSAGVRALVMTVDTPNNGARNRQDHAKFALPDGMSLPHMGGGQLGDASLDAAFGAKITWKDVEWLRTVSGLPLWLKGILTPEDASLAIEHGATGVIVSNHGGRNLDTAPATIDALPAIAEKVSKKIPILMDGGIRRGTDVVKALALGADAVLIGRPVLYGLAANGAKGVERVIAILRKEFEMALALIGRPSAADLDRSAIWPADRPV